MPGEKNLEQLLKTLLPKHNPGEYVFCLVKDLSVINQQDIFFFFKEEEGNTVVLRKDMAEQ